MKISKLENQLLKTPVIIRSNKESLLCLNKKITFFDGQELRQKIDDIESRITEKNIIILSNDVKCGSRFPRISVKEPFWELDFDKHLNQKFELAKKLFLTQSEIKNVIAKESKRLDFVVLIIVDGLSFTDCLTWGGAVPCLVDTLTTTECGFKNIIGLNDTIASYLFQIGYKNFLGFSYWGKDEKNQLTDNIFKHFSNVEKVQSLEDVIPQISKVKMRKTFVQIVTQGLDGIAHKNRELPLIDPLVQRIYKYVNELANILKKNNLAGKIYLTSDHGILWKHKSKLEDIPLDSSYHPRYTTTACPEDKGKTIITFNKKYTAMKYPYILRKMKSNEWGVHGGISLAESIVPFYSLTIQKNKEEHYV